MKAVADAGNLSLQTALHANSMLHFIQLFHPLFARKPALEVGI